MTAREDEQMTTPIDPDLIELVNAVRRDVFEPTPVMSGSLHGPTTIHANHKADIERLLDQLTARLHATTAAPVCPECNGTGSILSDNGVGGEVECLCPCQWGKQNDAAPPDVREAVGQAIDDALFLIADAGYTLSNCSEEGIDLAAELKKRVLAALPSAPASTDTVTILDALNAIADYTTGMTDSPDDEPRWEVHTASGMFAPVDMTIDQTDALDQIAALVRTIAALAGDQAQRESA